MKGCGQNHSPSFIYNNDFYLLGHHREAIWQNCGGTVWIGHTDIPDLSAGGSAVANIDHGHDRRRVDDNCRRCYRGLSLCTFKGHNQPILKTCTRDRYSYICIYLSANWVYGLYSDRL